MCEFSSKSKNDSKAVKIFEDFSVEEEYDNNGKVIRETFINSDGTVDFIKNLEYDEAGNVIREVETDSNGTSKFVTKHEYDADGNKVKSITKGSNGSSSISEFGKNGIEVAFVYNNVDGTQQIGQNDANGNTVQLTFKDANGNVISTEKNEYDENGQIVRRIEEYAGDKSTVTSTFDDEGRVKRSVYTSQYYSNTSDFRYDSAGKLISELSKDDNGSTTLSEYSDLGIMRKTYKTSDGMITEIVEYRYNQKGQCTGTVSKDAEGKVCTTSDYKLDKNGERIAETRIHANGLVEEFKNYELVKTTVPGANGGTVIALYKEGNITATIEKDSKGRTIREISQDNGEITKDVRYKYDAKGNLVQKRDASGIYEYSNNRLVRKNSFDSVTYYHYDSDGNLSNQTEKSLTGKLLKSKSIQNGALKDDFIPVDYQKAYIFRFPSN